MEYRKLGNTGLQVSKLSYGASSLGSVFKRISDEDGIRTVHKALEGGINYIDVSPYYGMTTAETLLGKALHTIPRDSYILSSKAGRYGEHDFDFSYSRILKSAEESMLRLNVDYLDVLFLHDIEFESKEKILNEAIPALYHLKETGKVRFIGISGFPLKALDTIIQSTKKLDLVLSYCHYTLHNNSLLDLLATDIGIVNASPLSMGLLTNAGPPKWHPAPNEIKEICQRAADYCNQKGENLSKLAIQYSVSNTNIPTTLVGTANPKYIEENISWVNEPMDMDLLVNVQEILSPIKNMTWKSGLLENN
ncbi:aldo/keto reductase [Bacillus sp. JJ1533]|uniref:aldo/keto reductase n=1 Tax=Bacillus sp. JJ1533 TaxID=3122959 RepID=UPI002FFE5F8C